MYRYRFAPAALRARDAAGRIRILGEDDVDEVIACYERMRSATHGLMTRLRESVLRSLRDRELRIVAVERDGTLRGFMQTRARLPANDELRNRDELAVRDLLAEDDEARAALIRYLRSQSDQFRASPSSPPIRRSSWRPAIRATARTSRSPRPPRTAWPRWAWA